ncbi:MAG: thioesterase family protein [Defluviitaleaceae bacterium]|nr:thioesterase family protein [Defluviitaleaceae bacterium]
MEHNLNIGMEFKIERVVTDEISAESIGSGQFAVFATPSMIMIMEQAAEKAVRSGLAEGFESAGMVVNVEHIAATPIGMKIEVRAVLKEIDGRRLVFDVEARDEREIIGRGVHERVIINKERFMARVNSK